MSTNMKHNNNRRPESPKRKSDIQQSHKKKNTGFIIGIIIVVILVAVAGTLFFLQSKKKESQVQAKEGTGETVKSESQSSGDSKTISYEGQTYEYNRDIKTVVFLGVDKKGDMGYAEHMGDGGQADSIILMALNEKEQTVKVFQISRNTMTNVDVYSERGEYLTTQKMQIALQYAYGDGEKKSSWLMKKAVSDLMYGVPVSSSIAMSIDGISAITTLMGGVEITVPKDYTYVDKSFEKGKTLSLKGALAEKYVRYRDITVTGSNNDRMERQTQFLMALVSQLKNASQKDTEIYSKLMTGANPYFTTDMSADEIMALSKYEIDGEIQTIPGEEKAGKEHDEFYTNEAELKEIVVKTFYKLKNM